MSRNQNQLLKEFSILRFNIKKENYRNINPLMSSMENLRNIEIKKRLYNIDEPPEIL
jgi:hypothetical protein